MRIQYVIKHNLIRICEVLQTAFRPFDLVRRTKIESLGLFHSGASAISETLLSISDSDFLSVRLGA